MIKHNEMVKLLVKDGQKIIDEMTPSKASLLHMTCGLSGESGEFLEQIKKNVFYGKELNRENLLNELGDLEFYLEGIRQELGFTREECLDANIKKLGKRYENFQYSNEAAIKRVDVISPTH